MKFKYDSVVYNTIDEVWEFIMDFSKRPEWIDFFDESFITEKTDNWIGSNRAFDSKIMHKHGITSTFYKFWISFLSVKINGSIII